MGLPTFTQRLFGNVSDNIAIQAFRFIVVGLVAFAVDFSLLMIAVNVWQWNYLVSAALAYAVGLSINYCLCVHWVFSQRRFHDRKPEILLFALIGITGLGLTELILWTGKDMMGLDLRLAKGAALLAVAVWNFLLRKILLFSTC
jgi:putative flippase GtrA